MAAGHRTATGARPCEGPLPPGFPTPTQPLRLWENQGPRPLLQPGVLGPGWNSPGALGGGRGLDAVPSVAGRPSSVCSSPFLFLIGTLMRAEGADPLPGAQFMPRLSHSSGRTRTTRQASGRPGAPAPGDGLSDRGELAAEVCGCCTVLSASTKGRAGPLAALLGGWGRMTSSSLAGPGPSGWSPRGQGATGGPGVVPWGGGGVGNSGLVGGAGAGNLVLWAPASGSRQTPPS